MTNVSEDLGPKGCPYLGLAEDRTVMLLEASPLHRCYADPSAVEPPTVQYQTRRCLCDEHVQCPKFVQAAPIVEGGFGVPAARPVRRQRGGMAQYIIGAFALLLLFGVVSWVALGLMGPRTQVSTVPTPVLATAEAAVTQEVKDALVIGDATPVPAALNATKGAATASLGSSAGDASKGPHSPRTGKQISLFALVTPTPVPGAQELQLRPGTGDVGWWKNSEPTKANLNDSYLYAGTLNGENYLAGMRFDLSRIPRGASILEGSLTLTGLRGDQMDKAADATWQMQLVGASELATLTDADFEKLSRAPAVFTLQPPLKRAQLGAGKVNTWELDANTLNWFEEQRLNGVDSVIVRIVSSAPTGANTLFGWDSGLGATTRGNGPRLTLTLGPGPTATPPLPLSNAVVATFTPVPANVLDVAAMAQTATVVAATTGTYTPVPDFVTPTPLPQNLATVQAIAVLVGEPAVVLETPVPENVATATALAAFATAVAKTTGTFTPVPTAYVTPFRVLPSPPAENLSTVVARNAEATATAAAGGPTPTPLPYNAVLAQYVVATVTPMNVATAAALADLATANAALTGAPTATPWEAVVITPTPIPPPPQPTPTPTLPIFIPEQDFTPTATPLPSTTEPTPSALPAEFKNKIFFQTKRSDGESVFVLDPATNEVGKITRDWVYPLAVKNLGLSPDGTKVAKVMPDSNRVLQIYVHSLQYGTDQQITNFSHDSYDPAWSPTGEWIAFVSTEPGNDEVYRVTPDGATVQRLTNNTYEWDKHPTWSPDGKQIVFYSNRISGRRQLWIMNADGSNQRNLTNDEFEDWDPVWTR